MVALKLIHTCPRCGQEFTCEQVSKPYSSLCKGGIGEREVLTRCLCGKCGGQCRTIPAESLQSIADCKNTAEIVAKIESMSQIAWILRSYLLQFREGRSDWSYLIHLTTYAGAPTIVQDLVKILLATFGEFIARDALELWYRQATEPKGDRATGVLETM